MSNCKSVNGKATRDMIAQNRKEKDETENEIDTETKQRNEKGDRKKLNLHHITAANHEPLLTTRSFPPLLMLLFLLVLLFRDVFVRFCFRFVAVFEKGFDIRDLMNHDQVVNNQTHRATSTSRGDGTTLGILLIVPHLRSSASTGRRAAKTRVAVQGSPNVMVTADIDLGRSEGVTTELGSHRTNGLVGSSNVAQIRESQRVATETRTRGSWRHAHKLIASSGGDGSASEAVGRTIADGSVGTVDLDIFGSWKCTSNTGQLRLRHGDAGTITVGMRSRRAANRRICTLTLSSGSATIILRATTALLHAVLLRHPRSEQT